MKKGFLSKNKFNFSKVKVIGLSAARDYFVHYFETVQNEKFAKEVLHLYKSIEKLKPEDFHHLMKQLMKMSLDIDNLRNSILELTENYNLANVTGVINSILVKDYSGKEDLSEKIQSIIFIARLAFPLGVNMKNPNMEKLNSDNYDNFSFDIDEYLTISQPSRNTNPIKIVINPGIKVTTINTNNTHTKECEISNGQGVLIGRPLKAGSILGHDFDDIVIKSHLCFDRSKKNVKEYVSEYKTFSRAGILLVRLHDRLFFFNRGSTNKIEIKNLRQNKTCLYSPDEISFNSNQLVA